MVVGMDLQILQDKDEKPYIEEIWQHKEEDKKVELQGILMGIVVFLHLFACYVEPSKLCCKFKTLL